MIESFVMIPCTAAYLSLTFTFGSASLAPALTAKKIELSKYPAQTPHANRFANISGDDDDTS